MCIYYVPNQKLLLPKQFLAVVAVARAVTVRIVSVDCGSPYYLRFVQEIKVVGKTNHIFYYNILYYRCRSHYIKECIRTRNLMVSYHRKIAIYNG